MSRKAVTRKKPIAQQSLVGRAVARSAAATSLREIRKNLTRVSVTAYLTEDGEPAPTLLGHLAVMIGVGAEIGLSQAPDAIETRRMHAALRTVTQMGIDGGRWNASQAKVLHEAAELSVKAFEDYPAVGVLMLPAACKLAEEVRRGTVKIDAVAGAEIYQKETT